jgi:hypothetical protein
MKIAFTGSSGSGKTTLATWLAEEKDLTFIPGSSGGLKTDEDRKFLKENFGFEGGKGHANVIQQSHINPELGYYIQSTVRRRRAELIRNNDDFVTDRSPLDNWVYFILQASTYQSQENCNNFLVKVTEMFKDLDAVIYVPSMFSNIENNGSRVSNVYFQQAVDAYFELCFRNFQRSLAADYGTKFLRIPMVDLQLRKDYIINNL